MSKGRHRHRHHHRTREARRRDAEARRVGREHAISCQMCGGPSEIHAYSYRVAGIGHSYRPTSVGEAGEELVSLHETQADRVFLNARDWLEDQIVHRRMLSGPVPLETDE